MARIRSIKPEFATDGANLRLSDSCALFFILLWTQCDDEGKHPYDLDQLVAELGGRWHRGKLKLFVSCLIKSGQLRINSTSTWIQVTGWSHQKIDKPKQPKVKAADLQWLTPEESANSLEQSRAIDARIGSDRIDRIGSDRVKRRKKDPPEAAQPEVVSDLNSRIWLAYADAYKLRYRTEPVRNAKTNSLIKQLGQRLGEEAIEVVRFYLQHNKSYYIERAHDLTVCVSDAESLRTQWVTGNKITRRQAQQIDDSQAVASQLQRIREGKL